MFFANFHPACFRGLNPNSEVGFAQTRRTRQACHPEESGSPSADGDDEPAAASPQFAENIHPSADGLPVQRNCRDSSSRQVGTQNDTGLVWEDSYSDAVPSGRQEIR